MKDLPGHTGEQARCWCYVITCTEANTLHLQGHSESYLRRTNFLCRTNYPSRTFVIKWWKSRSSSSTGGTKFNNPFVTQIILCLSVMKLPMHIRAYTPCGHGLPAWIPSAYLIRNSLTGTGVTSALHLHAYLTPFC